MRNLTAAVLHKIAERFGSEPINIVEIQWNKEGGNFLLYADKELDLGSTTVAGKVMDISNLESVLKLDSQSVTQSISVQLSDTDHVLKSIFDNVDIHGSVCRVTQWFPGISWSDRFKLFEGELSSPIVWSEGDKTLSFDVISKLEDKEVGFSPEDGDFNNIPDHLVGKPWPMAFGLVQNVPAVALQEVPTTQLSVATNVVDPSLGPKLAELATKLESLWELFYYWVMIAGGAAFGCDFSGSQEACSLQQSAESTVASIAQQIGQVENEISELSIIRNEQEEAQLDQLEVVDVKNIPQGRTLVLDINGVEFHGSFNGNIFTVSERIIPEWDGDISSPYGNIWINAGSVVRLKSEKSITYVANIIPSEVQYIQAYRRIGSVTSLFNIPSNYYTVDHVNLGDLTVTAITFDTPLSSINEEYEDNIYVTMESPIGPNTVDEMIWLIETFSDLSYDTTTFNYVRNMIDNYPSHFAMLEQKNLLEMLEEMAFQARCAIWVNNNTVYLKYLSEELAANASVSESDIDLSTLQIHGTDTEEIVTKLVVNWTDNYALEDPHKLILRHNVKKYGSRERVVDFYIYNINELVLKSATFWVIRLSNVWKLLHFESSLNLLNLETFDTISLNFNEMNFISNEAVNGLVTDLKYQSDDRTLIFDVWTPVKFGTMESYIFGWPSQIDPSHLFPTDEEIEQGYAGGNTVEITGGFTIGDEEIKSNFEATTGTGSIQSKRNNRQYGEQTPSDKDDEKPEPGFEGESAPDSNVQIWIYLYLDYEDITGEDGGEEDEGSSFSYPAVVTDYNEEYGFYYCNVYENGLQSDPVVGIPVTQLQIDEDERIPEDTWCLVAKNELNIADPDSILEGSLLEKPNADNTVSYYQYTMQIPVWL